MPTNKKGGKGFKKAKKNSFQTPNFETAQENQFYAKIIKKLGDRRFLITLHGSTEETTGRARGSLKGWHNMKKDDIILVSSRDFRNTDGETFVQDTYDIIQFYLPDQVRKLIRMNEITDSTFTDTGSTNIEYYNNDDEDGDNEESDDMVQKRDYTMPESESEDEDVDIEDI